MAVEPSPRLALPPFVTTARVVSSIARVIEVPSVPTVAFVDRPLDLAVVVTGAGVARCISLHATLTIVIERGDKSRTSLSVPVSLLPTGSGCILRAVVRPGSWMDAVSLTLVSLELAGQILPCDCLPATLRVGYNHAAAPDGAVFAAVLNNDALALQAALDAGASTEEADMVRVAYCATS